MRDPSGDAVTVLTWAFVLATNPGISWPVVRLYASTLDRGVRLVPGAAPAGRALSKSPTAYTVLPTIFWSHTTPSICTVGRGSAETCASVVSTTGGTVAPAGSAGHPTSTTEAARRVVASSPRAVLIGAVLVSMVDASRGVGTRRSRIGNVPGEDDRGGVGRVADEDRHVG